MDGARHLAQPNVGRLVSETDDPRVAEFMAALRENGDGDAAFGWAWLKQARLWRAKACGAMAAE